MALGFPRRARLFEFFVLVAVIGIASLFLLPALQRIEEDAERTLVDSTIRSINAAHRWAQAELVIQGRENERNARLSGSPVKWLQAVPETYRELERVADEDIRPGEWVWEKQAGILHYRPRRAAGLSVNGSDHLQWHWVNAQVTSFRSGLQPVHEYQWDVQ